MLRWTFTIALVGAVLIPGCRRGGSSGSFIPAASGGSLVVLETVPPPGAEGIAVDRTIAIAFSTDLDPATVDDESFQVRQDDTPLPGEITTRGREIFWQPAPPLKERRRFEVIVTDDIRGENGETLQQTLRFTFQTGSAEPFKIARILPPDSAQNVAPNVSIEAELTLDVDPASVGANALVLRRGSQRLGGTVRALDNVVELTLDAELDSVTTYTATLSGKVTDTSGRPLGEERVWSFTTRETVPPNVVLVFPEADAIEVDRAVAIEADFDEDLEGGTVDESSFRLQRIDGPPVSATVDYSDRRATLTPTSPLAPGVLYEAVLSDRITDRAGNSLETFRWSFETELDQVGPADRLEDDDSGDATEPHVSSAGEEKTLAIWTQVIAPEAGGDGQRSIYARAYDFVTNQWDPAGPVLLDQWDKNACHSPRVAQEASGSGWGVWLQEIEPDSIIWPMARRYDAAQRQWEKSSLQLADNKEVRVDSIRLAIDGRGNALAVWRDVFSEKTVALWARRYSASNGAWEKPLQQFPANITTEPRDPVVAGAPEGGFFVAWEAHDRNGNSDVVWARFEESWSTPQRLDIGELPAFDVSVEFSRNGDAFFVWLQHHTKDDADTPLADVRARRWVAKNGGFDTKEPYLVDVEDRTNAHSARLATDADGNALVVWIQALDVDQDLGQIKDRVHARRFDGTLGTWEPTPPWRLSTPSQNFPASPTLAQRLDGPAWVTWLEPGPSGRINVHGIRYDPSLGWGELTFVQSDLDETASAPAFAVGVQGAGFAVWPETGNGVRSIWSVRFP